ncbi:unnamed protein product [Prunus armeniaca]
MMYAPSMVAPPSADIVLPKSASSSESFRDELMNKNALIIRLLGRSHTYNYLHARLQQKWGLNGGWKLIDLKWGLGFCHAIAKITRMATWICVSAIQLECFDVWALKRIGNLLGKLLKIDALTTSHNRGKFA